MEQHRYVVGQADHFAPGEKRVVHVDPGAIPIVVVRTARGEFYAVRGWCAHQGAALGEGLLTWNTVAVNGQEYSVEREGEILRCPWHSFDYDLKTGRCLAAPDKLRVKTYPVTVEDEQVVILL